MKWPVIAPAWQYGDPAGFVDALIGRGERQAARGEAISVRPASRTPRDRFYTQARRLHIQHVMNTLRGKR